MTSNIEINGKEEKEFRNRQAVSQEEIALSSGVIVSVLPYKNEKRLWQAQIKNFGAALLKDIQFSDVNCETAAYIVSDILGFDLVPTTVIRNIDGKQFSVQKHLNGAHELSEFDSEYYAQLYLVWLFDHIIRSNDRERFNLLLMNEKVIAIDHEAAFYSLEDETHYDTFKAFYGEICPDSVIFIFKRILDQMELIQFQLRRDLSGLLEKNDIEETIRRIFYIAKLVVNEAKIDSLNDLTEVPT